MTLELILPAGLKSTKFVMASFSVAKVGVQGVLGPCGRPPIVRECERSLACSPSRRESKPESVLLRSLRSSCLGTRPEAPPDWCSESEK